MKTLKTSTGAFSTLSREKVTRAVQCKRLLSTIKTLIIQCYHIPFNIQNYDIQLTEKVERITQIPEFDLVEVVYSSGRVEWLRLGNDL